VKRVIVAYSNSPGLTSRSIEAEGCNRIVLFDLKSHLSYNDIPIRIGKLYSSANLSIFIAYGKTYTKYVDCMQSSRRTDITERSEEDECKNVQRGKVREDSIALDSFDGLDDFLEEVLVYQLIP
jgi:hypothetical protein